MTPELAAILRRGARQRAHRFGADALIMEKDAAALLKKAADAKRRYFREMAAVDLLDGVCPSPFEELGG